MRKTYPAHSLTVAPDLVISQGTTAAAVDVGSGNRQTFGFVVQGTSC